MPKGDGTKIEIVGVPKIVDDATLVKQLTMTTIDGVWRCKPNGVDPKQFSYGKKTVTAIAERMPPRTSVRIQIGHETTCVVIQAQKVTKENFTP